jgi:hypothetical protein
MFAQRWRWMNHGEMVTAVPRGRDDELVLSDRSRGDRARVCVLPRALLPGREKNVPFRPRQCD